MIKNKIKINGLNFENKIVISPMCQYSSTDGCPTDWHYNHLKNLIETGAGSLIIESTAVSKIGRITKKDLCLFNKKHYHSHKKLIKFLKNIHDIPIILQLSHSGRKGSAEIPFIKKNTPLSKKKGWRTWAPSNLKRSKGWITPREMTLKDIKTVINEFKNASRLAFKAGYDGLEIHMAHGYLIHQFCSPISNLRKDEYGVKNNNFKFSIEIIEAIKKIIPKNKILGARLTGNDHLKNGIKPKDCINLIKKLKKRGLHYACISSGGIIPITKLNNKKKAFRLTLARSIKKKTNILIRTSGNLNSKKMIEKILNKRDIDLIAIGREFLKNNKFLEINNF